MPIPFGQKYFLPNQHVRAMSGEPGFDDCQTVWFCKTCMREVEDALRERVAALHRRHGTQPKPYVSAPSGEPDPPLVGFEREER